MKRSTSLCLLGVVGFVGCGEPAPESATSAPTSATAPNNTDGDSAITFVTLKVPNMH